MTDEQRIRREIRDARLELKAKGLRRISCFNGGHSAESYRLNALLFRLETELRQCVDSARAHA
jgi:hypothetical protein